jgi:hypothetical protein
VPGLAVGVDELLCVPVGGQQRHTQRHELAAGHLREGAWRPGSGARRRSWLHMHGPRRKGCDDSTCVAVLQRLPML